MRSQLSLLAELIVAIQVGGEHAVSLLLAAALVAVSVAVWAQDRLLASLGAFTGAFEVLEAFPDVTGPTLTLGSGLLFAIWLAAAGVRLRSPGWPSVSV